MTALLALAADLPLEEALGLYPRLRPSVDVVKIGLSLFVEHGPLAVEAFRKLGASVFLDLKLHDIPNTVQLAAKQAAQLGVDYLTVHAAGGPEMLRAALQGAAEGTPPGERGPVLLAVTVLTSSGDDTLAAIGVPRSAAAQVQYLGQMSLEAGMQGFVCAVGEVSGLLGLSQGKAFCCTPGIRPAGAALGDQVRAQTPRAAVEAGAKLLVVGRPIYASADPVAAAAAIRSEMAS